MRKVLLISVTALSLSGCGWLSSSSISASSIDQNAAIQDSNDKLLIINILRARDKAPLHFGDIPKINETMQLSAGITPTLPFGPHTLTTASTIGATANIQDAPSFEMDNLDTQEFITGIMSPLKPKLLKYWLDRGLDPRIVMLVFVSSVTLSLDGDDSALGLHGRRRAPPKERVMILNSPQQLPVSDADLPLAPDAEGVVRTAYGIPLDRSGEFKQPFLSFLTVANWIKGDFFAVASPEIQAVGPPIKLDNHNIDKLFGDLSKVDPKNYELDAIKDGKQTFQLNAVGDDPKITLCFASSRVHVRGDSEPKPSEDGESGLTADKSDVCAGMRNIPAASDRGAAAPRHAQYCASIRTWLAYKGKTEVCTLDPAKAHVEFSLRSTGDVIHFLGDLLRLQEHPSDVQPEMPLNVPVTLGYCPDRSGAATPSDRSRCSDGGVLFNLETGDAKGRFGVSYQDGFYTVPNASDENHTLEVLAMLTQLVNLNKSGKDLRGTPTIRLIP